MSAKTKLHKTGLTQYAGKWVAVKDGKVIASGRTINDIRKYITRKKGDKTPLRKLPAAFKVPRKDEGPYVLILYGISLSKKR
ncbi:MAG: hypothetical protein UV22_C0004G0007 [Parcubacteria group bacterium GW2011_GWA2_42_35]|nr:MAG: hypothetical protein UU96_C0007G0011 [Parcubacteria group bacterium GW2011_GWC2_42_13]KKS58175.1 MAG: hypothetical protein UV22_C0004G0007 [Parcubacteria group bacterium GW2011_GWA2_42_35]